MHACVLQTLDSPIEILDSPIETPESSMLSSRASRGGRGHDVVHREPRLSLAIGFLFLGCSLEKPTNSYENLRIPRKS